MQLSRRHLLRLGGAALAGASVAPVVARAQTPKRGGSLAIRTWDPPHFDPFQTISYKTHIAVSFTHSRLLKHKAGPSVVPGTFPIEGDLAESWSQPSETAHVFTPCRWPSTARSSSNPRTRASARSTRRCRRRSGSGRSRS